MLRWVCLFATVGVLALSLAACAPKEVQGGGDKPAIGTAPVDNTAPGAATAPGASAGPGPGALKRRAQ